MILLPKSNRIDIETKIISFLIAAWITYMPDVVGSVLTNNFGIPAIPYQKGLFILLPFIYTVNQIMKKKRLSLPHLGKFIFMALGLILIELYNTATFQGAAFDLFSRWGWIYIFYILMVNLDQNDAAYMYQLEYFIISVFITNAFIILGITGIINFPISYEELTGRVYGDYNLNTFADLAALCVVLLLILKIHVKNLNQANVNILLGFFILVPVMTASRGAVLIILVMFLLFLTWKYFNLSLFKQIVFVSIAFILIVFIQEALYNLPEQLLVFRRFQELDFFKEGRGLQIIAAWINFTDSPWVGVGHQNAAYGVFHGIVRSNFQYLQIMAGSGILFTLYYLYYNYKIFVGSMHNLRNIIFIMILIFVAVKYLFRRPDLSFSMLMFVSWKINGRKNEEVE